MQRRVGILLVLLAILIAVVTVRHAKAQGVQNWVNNQYSNMQQDAQSGALSPVQANALERRDAQIAGQAQREMLQEGGGLTQAQAQQIGRELNNVNQAAGSYMRQNYQEYQANPYTRQYRTKYRAQYLAPYGSTVPNGGWQNWRAASVPDAPNAGQAGASSAGRRHHRRLREDYQSNGGQYH